jgi:para-aminobenzoate synthetase/4-amino-4-deoxychorismate lyase
MGRVPRLQRPDPDRGVFETFLVVEGRLIELDAHFARLGASVEVLFGATLTDAAREAVEERARDMSLGRLRVTLAPTGEEDGLSAEIVTAEVDPALVFPSPERAVVAHSFVVEGGLGSHKWADRDLIAAAESKFDAGEVPLIVDRGGVVLEASRANVFAVRGETLVTPPADGRLLPGIARRRVMEAADACGLLPYETELTIEGLVAADEVLLAGSVRGVEPVRAIDGIELGRPTGAGIRVAAELRRGWMPSPTKAY